ncbi:MAG: 2-phosphosulfolactate phosphatase [Verrucomicrobia bacterium]|nr:MAG: 2-phosphosulfolactate phosphatase [Verrucomicrobiota bacterium]
MIVDVVTHPSELPFLARRGIEEAVCVVFDVLRATSTMLTALAHGVLEIVPAATIEEALSLKKSYPNALLGGERHGDKIAGFDLGNSPLEYMDRRGAKIISTTTNGTIALKACEGAQVVLVGAVLNLDAAIEAVRALAPSRLIAVCSGTGTGVALEDVWAAGALAGHFQRENLTDEARMAMALQQAYQAAPEALRVSKNGRALQSRGRLSDVEWCENRGRLSTVGVMRAGAVRTWEAGA